jgi:hypothetical protein
MSGDIVERLRSEHRMALAPFHMSDAADEIERLRALADQLADAVQGLRQAAIIGVYRPSEELAAAHSALAAHAAARTNGSASATDVGGGVVSGGLNAYAAAVDAVEAAYAVAHQEVCRER